MNKKKEKKASKQISINTVKLFENTLQKLETIKNPNFETAKILSQYSFFDLAKTILIKNLKSNYNEIEFICAISTYLYQNNISLIEQNQLETHKIIIKETKQFYKQIKKSLKKIQSNFDETYLLYAKEPNKFFALENAKLIESLEDLSQIMNLTNKHHEAEIAFELKSKLELGFQRYFIHEKETILLYEFTSEGTYEIATPIQTIQIEQHSKTNIKQLPTINFKTNNFTEILIQLNYLKNTNKQEFQTQFHKYLNIIEFFPQQIYTKEEYKKQKTISTSINKNFTQNEIQLIKEKLILINPNDVNSYNLTLQLLK